MNTLVICPKCEKPNRVPLVRAMNAQPICGSCKTELPFHDGVQEVTGATLGKLLRVSDRPVVVDFWAEWCAPCKTFEPIFKNAAFEFGDRYSFAKVNTEKFPHAAGTYKIRGIPTLIVFKNGQEIDRQSGAMPLPTFSSYLRRWI